MANLPQSSVIVERNKCESATAELTKDGPEAFDPEASELIHGILSNIIFIWACGHTLFLIITSIGKYKSGCILAAKLSVAPSLAIKYLRTGHS